MSDLSNNLINATYKKLLQVSTSGNTGISGTLTNVQTGDGTNTAVKIATSAVQVDGTLFVGQTFGVSGDASVAGNLAISNKVCASAFHGDGSNLTGLVFTGDVSVSSLIVTNNVTVGGNVTIGGNIMVSGGEIQVKNTGTQSNIKLYCESSNAHYAALQAPPHSSFSGNITITLPTSAATLVGTSTTDTLTNKTFGDAVTFDDDISVSGNSNFGGTVTVAGATSLASTLSVGGAVNMLSTATVSGTAGFLGAVRVSGNTSVGGTLDVAGNVSLGGNVTVKGDVHVSSKVCASAFYGDGTNITGIPITGNISVSNANVGGTLFVSSTATIKGATSLASTLSVGGAVNLASTLTVAGNTSLAGTVSVGGAVNLLSTATVSGAAGFLTTARVSGNTSIGGTLDVAGNVSLGGNVTVKGDVHVSSKVCASAFFGDGANLTNVPAVITGNISVNNATIGGNAHIGGTVTVVGNGTFDGDISVSGDINVGGHVTIAGAVQLGSTLSVTGYSHFKDDVSVSGNAIIGGTVSVGGGIIDLKNTGSRSELRMYCESSNAHYAALKAPAHADFSGNIALVLPASADTLAGLAATQTFTNKTFGDKVDFDDDVCVSGNSIFVGNVAIGGTTTITGAVSLGSTLDVAGNASVSGNLNIGGTATIGGNTSVGGTLTVGGKAEFDGDVCISGNSQLVGTLKVTGATTVTGNTGFLGTVRVSGATSLEGAVIIDDTLTVTGATHLQSTASINSTLKVGGTTTITGNSGFLGTVRVSGNTSLEGQLQLTKSAAAVVCATAINGVASVSLNFGNAQNFSTTVTAAHTLAKPTGCRTGQTGSIFLTQSGGSGTMAYNADFKFIGGTDPTLSTDNGAVDRLDYIIVSASSDGVGGDIQMVISQAYA